MTVDDTLADLLAETRYLLLDFDGPVCSIFAGMNTATLADQIRATLNADYLPPDVETTADPLVVMQHAQTHDAATAHRVEAALAAAELAAVTTAAPTPGADETIKAATRTGRRVGIVSNNSEGAIRAYLNAWGLAAQVDVIAARTPTNAGQLKPHPLLLLTALDRLGIAPANALLVGDSPSDIAAAHAAKVTAIGYANKPGKYQRLANEHPDQVITNMVDLADALQA